MDDVSLMRAALEQARIAADLGEVPVGAVIATGDGEKCHAPCRASGN